MLLYLMRHAESAPTEGIPSDTPDSWHVTEEGRRSAARVASIAAQEFAFRPELILSSPWAAAKETVEPLREALGGTAEVVIEEAADPDAEVADVYRALARRSRLGSVAMITHVPLISRLLPDLLGAEAAIQIPQGGIACVQCRGEPGPRKGELMWLLPPRRWFDGTAWASEDDA